MMSLGVRTISLISFGDDHGIEDESGPADLTPFK
jgi:hypothetical protein